MFDSDEITCVAILVTDDKEVFACKGELVEANLVNVVSGLRSLAINNTVKDALDICSTR